MGRMGTEKVEINSERCFLRLASSNKRQGRAGLFARMCLCRREGPKEDSAVI